MIRFLATNMANYYDKQEIDNFISTNSKRKRTKVMYVKHLQEYLDQFTDGNKGTAISNAEIYVEMDNGRLEKIRRIEVQESTVIGAPSIRVVIKAEKRQAIISPTFKLRIILNCATIVEILGNYFFL